MKKLTIIALISCISIYAYSDEIKKTSSTLKEATVFFQGAELTHTASIALAKGENEIMIENLSAYIDQNSLKINATNGIIINSSEFSANYLTNNSMSNSVRKLQDSLDIYNRQLRQVAVNEKTNLELISLLQANKSIAGAQNGLSVTELMRMMDYYKTKSSELQNASNSNREKQENLNLAITRLTNQLNQEITKNNKIAGALKLVVISPIATTSNFTISYYTPQSSWAPYYNINVESTNKPIKIASKAKVKQTTGLDWNRVKINLSTSTPSGGKVAPLFSTWFLQYQQINTQLSNRVAGLAMQNSYSYTQDVPAMILEESVPSGYAAKKTKDTQPIYIVNGQVISANEYKQIDPNLVLNTQKLDASSASALYGSQAENGVILVTLKSMDDFVSSESNDLHMTYNIDLPYSIPGNGKEQIIDLHTNEVKADFRYYAAPKLDSETFLLAEISDWQNLNLLGGQANITYAGTYVGETVLNPNSTQATLNLTLGTEKRVSVKREVLRDYSSKKFLGNDIKQVLSYKITVKNNRTETVKMTLKDQYPISTTKEIEVELLRETTEASYNNEDVGSLTWNFDLKPGETKTFTVSYSVKYPKDKKLNL